MAISGLKQCKGAYSEYYNDEFSDVCRRECPMQGYNSVKFIKYFTKTDSKGYIECRVYLNSFSSFKHYPDS